MAQTPTALEILLEKPIYDLTMDEIVATVRGTAWTGSGDRDGTEITYKLRWRRTDDTRDTATDHIVEETTVTLDTFGIVLVDVGNSSGYHSGSENIYYITVEYVAVEAHSADFLLMNRAEGLVGDFEDSLSELQEIPVYNLYPQEVAAGTTFHWEIRNWNKTPAPVIRQNGTVVTPSTIDYDDGSVVLSGATTAGDDVELEYANFRFFDKDKLGSLLDMTIEDFNIFGPSTAYTRYDLPNTARGVVMYGARARALDEVCMSTIFFDRKLIFADEQVRTFVASESARMATAFLAWLPHSKKRSLAGGRAIMSHDKFDFPASYAWPGLVYYSGLRRRGL